MMTRREDFFRNCDIPLTPANKVKVMFAITYSTAYGHEFIESNDVEACYYMKNRKIPKEAAFIRDLAKIYVEKDFKDGNDANKINNFVIDYSNYNNYDPYTPPRTEGRRLYKCLAKMVAESSDHFFEQGYCADSLDEAVIPVLNKDGSPFSHIDGKPYCFAEYVRSFLFNPKYNRMNGSKLHMSPVPVNYSLINNIMIAANNVKIKETSQGLELYVERLGNETPISKERVDVLIVGSTTDDLIGYDHKVSFSEFERKDIHYEFRVIYVDIKSDPVQTMKQCRMNKGFVILGRTEPVEKYRWLKALEKNANIDALVYASRYVDELPYELAIYENMKDLMNKMALTRYLKKQS